MPEEAHFAQTTRAREIVMASTKLTQEKIEKICARLVEGVSLEAASEAAGIHRKTLYNWLKKAQEADASELHLQLADEVREAQALAEAHLVTVMRRAAIEGGSGDWRAAAWLLARRHPDRWSEKREIQISQEQKSDGTKEVLSMLAQLRETDEEENKGE